MCTSTVSSRGDLRVDASARGEDFYLAIRGDFYLAASGDLNLATCGDFFMATDKQVIGAALFRSCIDQPIDAAKQRRGYRHVPYPSPLAEHTKVSLTS